jgi:hypothetical protein
MYSLKKHLILTLAFTTACSYGHPEKNKNSIRKSTAHLVKATANDVHGAFCSTARGADHLLYPVLCFLVGKEVYNKGVNTLLPNAPEKVRSLEQSVPGLETGRHALTYLAIGGALCVGLNYVSNIPTVNSFLQKNMPHLAGLLQHVKIDLSSDTTVRKVEIAAKRK